MPNPGGGNQFGNYTLQTPYGDVKKQTALTREAPISGSPFSAHALNTPRRGEQQPAAPSASPAAPPPPLPPPRSEPSPMLTIASTWAAVASTPGAEKYPVLGQLAAMVQQ
jgi:hypothetical protein